MSKNDQSVAVDAELYNVRAATYGNDSSDLEHAIPEEAEECYLQDLQDVLGPFRNYQSVLEVGAGSGVLTRLLEKWGVGRIAGTDISEGMLKMARARLPKCEFKLIDREAEPDLFPSESFDLIISRQVICHFVDPIAVFRCWKKWLKPEGRIAIIEGLWTRRDWGPPTTAAGGLVDRRPLSCTQTWATSTYLLEIARLNIVHAGFLERVNRFAISQYAIGDPREPVYRYLVTATIESTAIQ